MRGRARVTRAKDRMETILALERAAPRPRQSFVAGKSGAAKINAARALKQIAANSGHVAHLGRSAGENRFRDRRQSTAYDGMIGHIAHARECADRDDAVTLFDLIERQSTDIDDESRCA